jgi:hypothetical protein
MMATAATSMFRLHGSASMRNKVLAFIGLGVCLFVAGVYAQNIDWRVLAESIVGPIAYSLIHPVG